MAEQTGPFIVPPPSDYDGWTMFCSTTAICPVCSREADEMDTDSVEALLETIDNHVCEETDHA